MSNLVEHAKKELELAGLLDKDSDYAGQMGEAVLKMIQAFAAEGHSGGSAQMAIQIFETLVRFQPLAPLTGADDEWFDHGNGVFQNKRLGSVFKDPRFHDGKLAFDIDAPEPRAAISFPYSPPH